MNEKIFLSIVIPAYNCAAWLKRSVSSAYGFSTLKSEVIVVDDGSTDDTASILASLKVLYPDLRVLEKQNGGAASARNIGIINSHGTYIVLLDADDELIPFDCQRFDGVDVARIGVEEVSLSGQGVAHSEEFGPVSGAEYLNNFFGCRRFYAAGCAYVYRRDFIVRNSLAYESGLLHEDMLFTVEALARAERVIAFPQLAYRYFRRADSQSFAFDEHKIVERVRSLRFIAKRMTHLANVYSRIDLGWWALYVIGYAELLAQRSTRRNAKWCVFLMMFEFMISYRVWGRYRSLRDVRYRLRQTFGGFLTNHSAAQ